ncbi:hypothetical protein FY034_04540 [Trichlorobacter lovleyi]|uniref:hypothetical protein n=1 Tax=Trichlorobacter lovleyi TaxID=313985 RepID=UPI0022403D06|nr:hypothetical protein [Trichlorobacter lovleyi]QOX78233.1 hypothetical protein FY034_04540 [Trichlorobacter lovleyi]
MKIIGIGGCGTALVNEAIRSGIPEHLCIAVDTDLETLKFCSAKDKFQIGQTTTNGLGTGCSSERGAKAASESLHQIESIISGCDKIIILSSIGGGTGSSLLSVLVELCQRYNIHFQAIAVMPFEGEGSTRKSVAENATETLRSHLRQVTMLNNDDVHKITRKGLSGDVFRHINEHIVNKSLKQLEIYTSIME